MVGEIERTSVKVKVYRSSECGRVRICNRADPRARHKSGDPELNRRQWKVVSNTDSPDTLRPPFNPRLEHHRVISLDKSKTLSDESDELRVASCESMTEISTT